MTISEVIEEAYDRVGVRPENLNGWHYRTARQSLQLLQKDWYNRGRNFWQVESFTQALTANTATYSLASTVTDLLDISVRGSDNQDISISPISVSSYQQLPNKASTGRPTQWMLLRGATGSTLYVWQVPPDNSYTLTGFRLHTDASPGIATASTVVPNRFEPALVAGMAYMLGGKNVKSLPSGEQTLMRLKADYDETWLRAEEADIQRNSIMLVPA